MPFRREERGQALVEFALLFPLILLLILGVIEFSFVWNSRNTVQFASREGSMLTAIASKCAFRWWPTARRSMRKARSMFAQRAGSVSSRK